MTLNLFLYKNDNAVITLLSISVEYKRVVKNRLVQNGTEDGKLYLVNNNEHEEYALPLNPFKRENGHIVLKVDRANKILEL